jgi:ribosomal protein S18 acetylase RimI-like enzyme
MLFWEALVEATFKAAGHADMEVLLALRREFCRHEEIAFDEQRAGGALARLLDDQSLGRVWLIGSGGATVGYVVLIFSHSLEFDGRDAYVDEIYLQEPCRGRGLGPKALLFAEEVCAALGVRALHLGVARNNSRALAAYLKAGFADRDHFLLTKRIATRSG